MLWVVFLYFHDTWKILKFLNKASHWFITFSYFDVIWNFFSSAVQFFFIDTNFFAEERSYSFPKYFRNISYIEVIIVIFLCYSINCNKTIYLFVVSGLPPFLENEIPVDFRSFQEKSVLFSRRKKRASNNMPPKSGQQKKNWISNPLKQCFLLKIKDWKHIFWPFSFHV